MSEWYGSPDWVLKIQSSLSPAGGQASDAKSSCTIYPVPSNWRAVDYHAFSPEMIRIGPFRFRDGNMTRVQVMEEHKVRFVTRLLEGKLDRWRSDRVTPRTTEGERGSADPQRVFADLVEAMRKLEKETRDSYSVTSEKPPSSFRFYFEPIPSEDFVEMMLVDGCFVVELLRLHYDLLHSKIPAEAIEDDPIFTNPRILTTIRRDLLLLENQLPFFVLEKLYEFINKKNDIDQQAVPLEELAVTFFDPLLPQPNAASKLDAKKPKAHLLEVFRSTFLKSVSEKVHEKGKSRVNLWLKPDGSIRGPILHFASELQEAGVQFKKSKGHDLLDIESGYGTLRVPPLSLNNNTLSLLLNFVAYELSINHPEPFFANYFMFWDSLVDSPRDIQILHEHGIINYLGSEGDMATLLMRCREVIYDLDLGYLRDKIKEVNVYCERCYESKYRVWWRSLIRERFSSPWTCLSLFDAIILLPLLAIQTIYIVYPYYRSH